MEKFWKLSVILLAALAVFASFAGGCKTTPSSSGSGSSLPPIELFQKGEWLPEVGAVRLQSRHDNGPGTVKTEMGRLTAQGDIFSIEAYFENSIDVTGYTKLKFYGSGFNAWWAGGLLYFEGDVQFEYWNYNEKICSSTLIPFTFSDFVGPNGDLSKFKGFYMKSGTPSINRITIE